MSLLKLPMSTSSAAASQTAVDSNHGSSINSPPLITFLVVALFTTFVILVFGWRNHGWRSPPIDVNDNNNNNNNRPRVDVVPLDKPKLWDLTNGGMFVWGQVKEGARAGSEVDGVRWVDLMVCKIQNPCHQTEAMIAFVSQRSVGFVRCR